MRGWKAKAGDQPLPLLRPPGCSLGPHSAVACPFLMMKLTSHAEEMIALRGISLSWIEATVSAPEWSETDPRNPDLTRSFLSIPEAGGRILRVVHRPDGPHVLVITVFLDRGAKR